MLLLCDPIHFQHILLPCQACLIHLQPSSTLLGNMAVYTIWAYFDIPYMLYLYNTWLVSVAGSSGILPFQGKSRSPVSSSSVTFLCPPPGCITSFSLHPKLISTHPMCWCLKYGAIYWLCSCDPQWALIPLVDFKTFHDTLWLCFLHTMGLGIYWLCRLRVFL